MTGTNSTERLVLSVAETAMALDLSINSTYEAIRRGEIPSVRIGGRILVSRRAIEDLLTGRNGGA